MASPRLPLLFALLVFCSSGANSQTLPLPENLVNLNSDEGAVLLKESEATVSRQLARTRGVLRKDVEDQLAGEHRLSSAEIARCFASITQDAGPLDVGVLLGSPDPRKNGVPDRSQ